VRQLAYEGLIEDKPAREVRRPVPHQKPGASTGELWPRKERPRGGTFRQGEISLGERPNAAAKIAYSCSMLHRAILENIRHRRLRSRPSNSVLESSRTTPWHYPESSGFGWGREREWGHRRHRRRVN
jgi:hypothetical protein